MSALGLAGGRHGQLLPQSRNELTLRRHMASPRQRCRTAVRSVGSEQGSAPEDLGGGIDGAAQQIPSTPGESSSDAPVLRPPSTVQGPKAAGDSAATPSDQSLPGSNAGVRQDAPGSAPELDGAAEAQATPTAQASNVSKRKKGGLLSLQKSDAARRAAARAARERAVLDSGLKDAKSTGVLAVATLTAGALAIGQVVDAVVDSARKNIRSSNRVPIRGELTADQRDLARPDSREDTATPVSPVPVPQRADPAVYSMDREAVPPPLPTPAEAHEGGQGSSAAAAVQPLSSYLRQSVDSATADLPSSQQQADSLKEWSQSVWSAAEQASRRNAEAAESIGRNLGEWAAGLGRAFKGSLDSSEQMAEELARNTNASFVEGGKTAPGAVAGRESRETMWRRPVDPPKLSVERSAEPKGLQQPSATQEAAAGAKAAAQRLASWATSTLSGGESDEEEPESTKDVMQPSAQPAEPQQQPRAEAPPPSRPLPKKLPVPPPPPGSSQKAEPAPASVTQQPAAQQQLEPQQQPELKPKPKVPDWGRPDGGLDATRRREPPLPKRSLAQPSPPPAAAAAAGSAGPGDAPLKAEPLDKLPPPPPPLPAAAGAVGPGDAPPEPESPAEPAKPPALLQPKQPEEAQPPLPRAGAPAGATPIEAAAAGASSPAEEPLPKQDAPAKRQPIRQQLQTSLEARNLEAKDEEAAGDKGGFQVPRSADVLPWARNRAPLPAREDSKRPEPPVQRKRERNPLLPMPAKPEPGQAGSIAFDRAAAEAAVKASTQSAGRPPAGSQASKQSAGGITAQPPAKPPAAEEVKQPATEEAKQSAAEEAKQPAAEEAKQLAAEETKQPAAEEAKQPAADEAKRLASEEAKQPSAKRQVAETRGASIGPGFGVYVYDKASSAATSRSGGDSGGAAGGSGGSGGGGGGAGDGQDSDADDGDDAGAGGGGTRWLLLAAAAALGAAVAVAVWRHGSLPSLWKASEVPGRAALVAAAAVAAGLAAAEPLTAGAAAGGAGAAWAVLKWQAQPGDAGGADTGGWWPSQLKPLSGKVLKDEGVKGAGR